MANIQYSRYEKGIDLQDHSSSYSSNAGAIYLSGTYMNFRSDLDMNSAGISNMADPESAQDAATKAYVDAQITAQDLDFQGDSGGALSIDLDSETLSIVGTANEIETAGSGNTLTIGLPDSVTIGDALTVTGLLSANGSVDLGDATSDTITATGRFDSDLVPSTDSARALGSSALQWSELHVDVGYIDRLAAAMDCDSQAMTNVNVDSGNIDGTIIGAASRAAASVTTLDANSTLNADGAATFGSTVSGSGAAQFASLHCDSVNLDGGSMDGVAIGAAERSTAQFTTVDANSTFNADGAATLGSTLGVTGIATFSAAIDANSTSDFQGAMNLQAGITVAGAADLNGALDVAGAVDLAASGVETGIRGTLAVDEAASFDSTIAAAGQVSGSAAGKFLSLAVNTNKFEVDSDGNADASGYVIADGRGMFGGRLDVTGAFDAAGAANLQSTLAVAGAADLNGALDVAGAVDLAASGVETDIRGTLSVDEAAVFDSTVTVTGASTFNAAVDVASGGLSANSLKVDDLTDGRLLLAGASGEVEDSANLTYNGSTLDIAAAVSVDGDITLDSDHDVKARAFITYSDAALKTNVETVTNAMDMIQGLRGVSYDLKDGGKREFGFIAQEVNTVVPEVVSTKNNMMGIDYTRITSLLVEAVKTQQAQIEALKAKLDK